MQGIQIIISTFNVYKNINETFYIPFFFILRFQNPVNVLHFRYIFMWTSQISNTQ